MVNVVAARAICNYKVCTDFSDLSNGWGCSLISYPVQFPGKRSLGETLPVTNDSDLIDLCGINLLLIA